MTTPDPLPASTEPIPPFRSRQDERRDAAHFLRLLALFLIPFAVIYLLVTAAMLYTGEGMPLAWVVGMQQHDPAVLYRPRYGNRDPQFKILSVNMRQPDVVALGSSRVLQFRAGFFDRQPDAFYNAAGPAWDLKQVIDLYESFETVPDVLILAIDPPWFNTAYQPDILPLPKSDIEHLLEVNNAVIQDVLTGASFDRPNFSMEQYVERRSGEYFALGLRAIRDGHGFRGDGSEQYGDFLVAGWLNQNDARDIHRVWLRDGLNMYVPGSEVDLASMVALHRLFDMAKARGTTVIGFLPSYMPSLWDAMTADGQHEYVTQLTLLLEEEFASYDFPFFDFSDGASVDTPDEEFFDGWHASELSNLRLYIRMVEALPDVLGAYSDADALRAIAESAPNTWDVFGAG